MPTDVEVSGLDGRSWVGTVATLSMIDAATESYRESGDCLSGTYFWVSDLLLVGDGTEAAVFESVFSLVATGEIDDCFQLIESE